VARKIATTPIGAASIHHARLAGLVLRVAAGSLDHIHHLHQIVSRQRLDRAYYDPALRFRLIVERLSETRDLIATSADETLGKICPYLLRAARTGSEATMR
jgi:hypothetical protein